VGRKLRHARKRHITWALIAAAAVIALLLAHPTTRWVVVEHVRRQASASGATVSLTGDLGVRNLPAPAQKPNEDHSSGAVLLRAAQAHPNDVGAQIVAALLGPDGRAIGGGAQKAEALRAVGARLPGWPQIWANVLRYDCQGNVRMGRESDQNVAYPPGPGRPVTFTSPPHRRPKVWPHSSRGPSRVSSATGRNAYFPQMRALGLFALHRNREALASLHRAAACGRWDDYSWVETEATLRLRKEVFARHGALVDATSWRRRSFRTTP